MVRQGSFEAEQKEINLAKDLWRTICECDSEMPNSVLEFVRDSGISKVKASVFVISKMKKHYSYGVRKHGVNKKSLQNYIFAK